ncbi:MAG TPA: PEP-CTERM sorting domain-containing protein [Phycisphaerae bacterium]|nr:PEP-CTERM sorting domain-containing protein [Phycisphaerae bacterium]
MQRSLVISLVVCFLVGGTALGAPIIDVGTHKLLENAAGQTVVVLVTGTDQVTGFNLNARLGDGEEGLPEPVFESVDFAAGMWDAGAHTVMGGPLAQYVQASVVFNQTMNVSADGLLVTLTIDTTGFFNGESFPLILSGVTEIGPDSHFITSGAGTLAADITNGTIEIVPEPASLAILALGGLAILGRRTRPRRRR